MEPTHTLMLCLEFQLFKNMADGIDYCATGFFKDPQVLDQELLLRLTGHILYICQTAASLWTESSTSVWISHNSEYKYSQELQSWNAVKNKLRHLHRKWKLPTVTLHF